MKRFSYIYFTIILIACQTITAQELKSEKSSLIINNIPVVEDVEIRDNEPPDVEFISPKIYLGTRFYTQQQELDLIGKVTDNSRVSLVMINGVSHPLNEAGLFTHRLNLNPGDNRVRIVAMDEKDNLRDVFFLVDYTPPRVTLADRISSDAIYYGLIIGIDQYDDDEIPDLDNPVRDARKLYETLSRKYNFQEDNITFIENATRAQIIQSLDSLAVVITEEDNLLIFYAGHGYWMENSNNGFWLPSDADPILKTNWFRNSTLVDYLKEIDSKHTLLITDACFAGSIFAMRSAFGNREKAYEKLYELPSRKAMTSGRLELVPDRSSFTRFLIERLEENTETYLSSEELFSSFRLAVINNSDVIPRYGEIEKVGDEGGDFIFLLKQ